LDLSCFFRDQIIFPIQADNFAIVSVREVVLSIVGYVLDFNGFETFRIKVDRRVRAMTNNVVHNRNKKVVLFE
jgi:hypothetical protein